MQYFRNMVNGKQKFRQQSEDQQLRIQESGNSAVQNDDVCLKYGKNQWHVEKNDVNALKIIPAHKPLVSDVVLVKQSDRTNEALQSGNHVSIQQLNDSGQVLRNDDDDDDDADDLMFSLLDDKPNEIITGLYISSYLAEGNKDGLLKCGITHILQVGDCLPQSFKDSFEYKQILVLDCDGEDIVKHFAEAFPFISEGLQTGGCLVHCLAGVSRSATMCIGYLMTHRSTPLNKALQMVRTVRPQVNPNPGFQLQLRELERLGGDLSKYSGVQQLIRKKDSLSQGLEEMECGNDGWGYDEAHQGGYATLL